MLNSIQIQLIASNSFFLHRKPASGCSYVSPHYKSHCIQVYNYHRLLSFEEPKGMHVDIYKVKIIRITILMSSGQRWRLHAPIAQMISFVYLHIIKFF